MAILLNLVKVIHGVTDQKTCATRAGKKADLQIGRTRSEIYKTRKCG